MNAITALSEITAGDVLDYLGYSAGDTILTNELNLYIEAAKAYVYKYTGLTTSEADEAPDLAVAALVLIADMYDNKTMIPANANTNRVVWSILDMHSRNLLPEVMLDAQE